METIHKKRCIRYQMIKKSKNRSKRSDPLTSLQNKTKPYFSGDMTFT